MDSELLNLFVFLLGFIGVWFLGWLLFYVCKLLYLSVRYLECKVKEIKD